MIKESSKSSIFTPHLRLRLPHNPDLHVFGVKGFHWPQPFPVLGIRVLPRSSVCKLYRTAVRPSCVHFILTPDHNVFIQVSCEILTTCVMLLFFTYTDSIVFFPSSLTFIVYFIVFSRISIACHWFFFFF